MIQSPSKRFVWIMGFSSVLSLNSQLRRALSKRRIFLGIFRRSTILFFIGLALNSLSNSNIYTLRIPGVLQRLGFVYFIVAVLELLCLDPEDNQRVLVHFFISSFRSRDSNRKSVHLIFYPLSFGLVNHSWGLQLRDLFLEGKGSGGNRLVRIKSVELYLINISYLDNS
jgi:hypothetical protein